MTACQGGGSKEDFIVGQSTRKIGMYVEIWSEISRRIARCIAHQP